MRVYFWCVYRSGAWCSVLDPSQIYKDEIRTSCGAVTSNYSKLERRNPTCSKCREIFEELLRQGAIMDREPGGGA